ncbi:hypothetical protein BIFGAL_04415 [Bifidobacterium gallicum DSM 20093 = LMG 11596]|nr:hypothetical protein BIFGAL_04415 [Bifidobacterium gallicum DSM 20093 = LMG 11596]
MEQYADLRLLCADGAPRCSVFVPPWYKHDTSTRNPYRFCTTVVQTQYGFQAKCTAFVPPWYKHDTNEPKSVAPTYHRGTNAIRIGTIRTGFVPPWYKRDTRTSHIRSESTSQQCKRNTEASQT